MFEAKDNSLDVSALSQRERRFLTHALESTLECYMNCSGKAHPGLVSVALREAVLICQRQGDEALSIRVETTMLLKPPGCGSKLKKRGVTQVSVHVPLIRVPFWCSLFEPQPPPSGFLFSRWGPGCYLFSPEGRGVSRCSGYEGTSTSACPALQGFGRRLKPGSTSATAPLSNSSPSAAVARTGRLFHHCGWLQNLFDFTTKGNNG